MTNEETKTTQAINGKGNSIVLQFGDPSKKNLTVMEPISPKQVGDWARAWDDEAPIKDNYGKIVKGWRIDKDALQLIKDKGYEEIYLRLGKKGNKLYTVMVLGMKGGGVMQPPSDIQKADDSDNFDHLDPCPVTGCPNNFE